MSRSLKDKRQVVKSLVAQAQRELHLAVGEVDQHDRWQVAVIGVACVSTDAGHADEVLSRAVALIAGRRGDAELLDYQTEIIHAF